jgi:hypothetical protein
MVVASDRLLNCARCQQQLRVCRRCDHGQRYCPEPCAHQARRACVRAAGHRYQQTLRGRLHHARRQSLGALATKTAAHMTARCRERRTG